MTLVCTGCVILWGTGLRHPIKEYRGIATRHCKRAQMYGGLLNLVSTFLAFREAVSLRPAGGRPAVNRRPAL